MLSQLGVCIRRGQDQTCLLALYLQVFDDRSGTVGLQLMLSFTYSGGVEGGRTQGTDLEKTSYSGQPCRAGVRFVIARYRLPVGGIL